jgi:hypothetical protein
MENVKIERINQEEWNTAPPIFQFFIIPFFL